MVIYKTVKPNVNADEVCEWRSFVGFMLPFSLSVVLSMTDVTVSRGFFIGQWRKNGGAVNIYLSLTHAHTHVHAHAHTLSPSVTSPSCDLHKCHYNGWQTEWWNTHYNGHTHHIDIWITHVWINHTTLMWLVDEALKQLTDRGHLRWESL